MSHVTAGTNYLMLNIFNDIKKNVYFRKIICNVSKTIDVIQSKKVYGVAYLHPD